MKSRLSDLEVDRLERQNQKLVETVRKLKREKDTGHEDRHEFVDPIDDQEAEELYDESKVEDWCALLVNTTNDAVESENDQLFDEILPTS